MMESEKSRLSITADIGSTNGRWVLHRNDKIIDTCSSRGFNPFQSDWNQLEKMFLILPPNWLTLPIENFNFYGAGVINPEVKEKIRTIASDRINFKNAVIASDIELSVHAFNDPSNQCVVILGTGCNAVFCESKSSIRQIIPSLGYAIGDEGSGAYFGKKLISAYFYNQLDEELQKILRNKYDMERPFILEQVYKKSSPGKYLANFFPFLMEYKDHPQIAEILSSGLDEHIRNIILPHPEFTVFNYTGSVAYTLSRELSEKFKRNHLSLGLILKDPLEYFIKNL